MSGITSAKVPRDDLEEAKNILHYLCGDDKTDTDDIVSRFSKNSHIYDKVSDAVSYSSPMQTAKVTAELFPGNREHVYILDAAAGTGLCAEKLFAYGFRKIDALDPSAKMLEQAKTKGLYCQYYIKGLGESTLDIANETYDAVTICALSTVVLKKLPIKAFEELIRITKPGKYRNLEIVGGCTFEEGWKCVSSSGGGYIINTAYSSLFPDDGDAEAVVFRENMKTLEGQGKWKQVELTIFHQSFFESDGAVSVHKVLK